MEDTVSPGDRWRGSFSFVTHSSSSRYKTEQRCAHLKTERLVYPKQTLAECWDSSSQAGSSAAFLGSNCLAAIINVSKVRLACNYHSEGLWALQCTLLYFPDFALDVSNGFWWRELSVCSSNTSFCLKYTSKTRTGFMRHYGWTRGQGDMFEFPHNEGDASDSKAERLLSLKSVSVPHSTVLDSLIFLLLPLFCCFVRWSLT